jgi:hypothetical protein
LTTLSAGKYRIFGQVWGTTGLTAGVKADGVVVWQQASTGSLSNNTSEEFILTKTTDLYVYTTGGSDNHMLDLIYITRTGDPLISATVGSTGWATYSNATYNLDFTGLAVKAYKATLTSENKVKLSPVTTVPAGTGVLLNATAGDHEIPVISSADAIEDNLLKASADADIAASTDEVHHYVLANGASGLGFYNLAEPKNIGAGKAYLETTEALATEDGGKGSRVDWIIDGEGEVTAIKSLGSEDTVTNGYLDLQGRRVIAPQKGLYIVNGKKVIIK